MTLPRSAVRGTGEGSQTAGRDSRDSTEVVGCPKGDNMGEEVAEGGPIIRRIRLALCGPDQREPRVGRAPLGVHERTRKTRCFRPLRLRCSFGRNLSAAGFGNRHPDAGDALHLPRRAIPHLRVRGAAGRQPRALPARSSPSASSSPTAASSTAVATGACSSARCSTCRTRGSEASDSDPSGTACSGWAASSAPLRQEIRTVQKYGLYVDFDSIP